MGRNCEMTSKERILAAFRREIPDRVPVVTFGINPYDRESWVAKDPSFRRVLSAAAEKSDIFYRYNVDTGFLGSDPKAVGLMQEVRREGDSRFVRSWIETAKGPLTSLTRFDDGVATSWKLEPYVKTEEDAEALLSLPYEPISPDLSGYHRAVEELDDRGVMHITFIDPLMAVLTFTTFEFGAILAVSRPELFTKLLDMFYQRLYQAYRSVLEAGIAPVVVRFGGCEYATVPLMHPRYFEDYVVKYDKPISDLIKSYEDCYVQLHCHGRMKDVIDGIMAIEPHAVEPIEPPPQGDIPLAEFKAKYGHRVCLVGNIEFDDMDKCSPEEMEDRCREAIEAAAPGGGFILTQTAPPITSLTPRMEENYLKFIEAGIKYGRYR
ncbi:MAG: uroporphyrinogen decarboxylase family protein [bacterium]